MKKRLLLLLLFLSLVPLASLSAAGMGDSRKKEISALIERYKRHEGVEALHLGRLATGALKSAARISSSSDRQMRDALLLMKGVKSLAIFEFDGCPDALKAEITRRMDTIFKGEEAIMEMTDSGETMKVFGQVDEAKGIVKDLVLYSPSECALICIFGSVSMESLSRLMTND